MLNVIGWIFIVDIDLTTVTFEFVRTNMATETQSMYVATFKTIFCHGRSDKGDYLT